MPDKKLTELDPRYVNHEGSILGFDFNCPICQSNEGAAVHKIGVLWQNSHGQPDDVIEVFDRENFNRISISFSIFGDIPAGCKFHGWIKNGMVMW